MVGNWPLGKLAVLLTHWPLGNGVIIFKSVVSKHTLQIKFMSNCEIAPKWMAWNSIDKSTLALVMAWCPQAISHYLSQYWPRSLSPCGITRTEWVKCVIVKLILVIDLFHGNRLHLNAPGCPFIFYPCVCRCCAHVSELEHTYFSGGLNQSSLPKIQQEQQAPSSEQYDLTMDPLDPE